MGYIYAHINKINNKRYIGQAKDVGDRWKYEGIKYKTCPRFWSAIQHYGWNNFQHIILEETDNLDEREKYWISYYDTTNPEKGYNLTLGGTGGDIFSTLSKEKQDEWREKCRKANEERGKQWHEKLSEAQKKAWAEGRRTKGLNEAGSKTVRCVETGIEYPSCAEAMQAMGKPRNRSSYISRVANKQKDRKTYNGYHWEWV